MLKTILMSFTMLILFFTPYQVYSAGVVLPGTTELTNRGLASNPALWWLEGDFTTPEEAFLIGKRGYNYNYLSEAKGILRGPKITFSRRHKNEAA